MRSLAWFCFQQNPPSDIGRKHLFKSFLDFLTNLAANASVIVWCVCVFYLIQLYININLHHFILCVLSVQVDRDSGWIFSTILYLEQ